MNELMLTTLSAMQRDAYRLERASANMANMLTPGYKRERVAERMVAPDAAFDTQVSEGLQTVSGGGVITETQRDLKPGPLRPTGRELDLALSGPGVFELRTAQGPAYTRLGEFHVDERGQLVTAKGDLVMGTLGPLSLDAGPLRIGSDGTVRQDDRVVGQIRVLVPDAGTQLQAIGDGLFVTEGRLTQAPDGQAGIRQGFTEGSNVDTAQEMVQVMGAIRHFESMTRATQMYDDMMSTAVRKLTE